MRLLGGVLSACLGRLRPGGGGALAVEQVLALDPRRRLWLMRCDGRRLLLLTGGASDVVVGWLDPPAPISARNIFSAGAPGGDTLGEVAPESEAALGGAS